MVGVPGESIGQGLRLVVVGHRHPVPPAGVAAGQLHRSRQPHELDQQESEQPKADAARLPVPSRTPAREEQAREQGLREQRVPLEAHEVLPHGADRQVADPRHQQQGPLEGQAQDQADTGQQTHGHHRIQRVGGPPEHRGRSPEGPVSEGAPHRLQPGLVGEDAVGTDQPVRLHREGEEGDARHDAERPEEQPPGQRVGRGRRDVHRGAPTLSPSFRLRPTSRPMHVRDNAALGAGLSVSLLRALRVSVVSPRGAS